MAFTFKTSKTIQAVAVLLKKEHGYRMNFMRLLKLLYIADRESIQETGMSITGDHVVAMDRGPVLSNVLNLIRSEHPKSMQWDKVIRKDGYDVELIDDPGNGAMSRYEIRKLHDISSTHAQHDEWDMVRITHTFTEWFRNKPERGSQNPIPLEDILEAVGRSADKDAIIGEAQYAREMDRIFG